jgi:hypothetical protein
MTDDQFRIVLQQMGREKIKFPFVFHLAAWLVVAFILVYAVDSVLRHINTESQINQQKAELGTP